VFASIRCIRTLISTPLFHVSLKQLTSQCVMWDPFQSKKADVISHWYALIPSFRTSTQEFYIGVETELQTRQVPDLEASRVEFS
jgi:hypothetical protein